MVIRERVPEKPELERQNIVYRPMVWTTFGRPRTATNGVILSIARRIARRRGSDAGFKLAYSAPWRVRSMDLHTSHDSHGAQEAKLSNRRIRTEHG